MGPWLFILMINYLNLTNFQNWKYINDTIVAEIIVKNDYSTIQSGVNELEAWTSSNKFQLKSLNARNCLSRLRLHGSGRIRNRSPICTVLPVYTEPWTVRFLFFKVHGTGQIKILSLSQCIMVVVLFRTVENTPVEQIGKN